MFEAGHTLVVSLCEYIGSEKLDSLLTKVKMVFLGSPRISIRPLYSPLRNCLQGAKTVPMRDNQRAMVLFELLFQIIEFSSSLGLSYDHFKVILDIYHKCFERFIMNNEGSQELGELQHAQPWIMALQTYKPYHNLMKKLYEMKCLQTEMKPVLLPHNIQEQHHQ